MIKLLLRMTCPTRMAKPGKLYSNPSIGENWILTIQNNMSYAQRDDAKTIVRLHEASPSEKFVEIAMFADSLPNFWTAVNTEESGYIKVYERTPVVGVKMTQ